MSGGLTILFFRAFNASTGLCDSGSQCRVLDIGTFCLPLRSAHLLSPVLNHTFSSQLSLPIVTLCQRLRFVLRHFGAL